MAARKKKKRRTISPEQQQKMQAGRQVARCHWKRMKELYASSLVVREPETRTERMLHSVERHKKARS